MMDDTDATEPVPTNSPEPSEDSAAAAVPPDGGEGSDGDEDRAAAVPPDGGESSDGGEDNEELDGFAEDLDSVEAALRALDSEDLDAAEALVETLAAREESSDADPA